jgi:hypothetical protein
LCPQARHTDSIFVLSSSSLRTNEPRTSDNIGTSSVFYRFLLGGKNVGATII